VAGVPLLLDVRLPLRPMLACLAVLALFNLACTLRARTAREVRPLELLAGLGVDLAVLTALLALAGGIHNPFVFLYLPQVAIAALLLPRPLTWGVLGAATVAMAALSAWHLPLQWPDGPAPPLPLAYVAGVLLCFVICAVLVVRVIVRFGQTLRRRDERLAALRQRAAEEDHIVRMGLLASGAAHELGTPLATLSVILGDWSRMAPITAEPELREELEQMQRQVERCKTIISGILMSAGSARAEISGATTLAAFLHDVAGQWSRRRATAPLTPELGALPDVPIAADAGLRQMITNLLDNALEAAPHARPRLLAECDEHGHLRLQVIDRGPGFPAEVLANFGRPYHSTKGKPGGGLGIFLSVNVGLLIVEDDDALAASLRRSFERRGWQVRRAPDLEGMQALLADYAPTHAVVDLKLAHGGSGLACVQALHRHDATMAIVVLTGFASIATAVEAIKLGARHYLAKPANTDDIEAAFERAEGETDLALGHRPTSLKTLEWERIHETLAETGFNISETARRLGLHRRTLARKLEKQRVK